MALTAAEVRRLLTVGILAGDPLVCSELAAGLPQLLRSPCVPLLGPAALAAPTCSRKAPTPDLVRPDGTGPLRLWGSNGERRRRGAWGASRHRLVRQGVLGRVSEPSCASVSKCIKWGSPCGLLLRTPSPIILSPRVHFLVSGSVLSAASLNTWLPGDSQSGERWHCSPRD